MFIISIIIPCLIIPQVWETFVNKDAGSVNVSTWVAFWIGAASWITYGISKNDKQIVMYNSLFLTFESAVIVMYFLYK